MITSYSIVDYMNNKEKTSWQEDVKNRHKEGIIALLQEQPNKAMRFADLLAKKDRTGIKSPKGLTEVLQRLIQEGLVENTHIDVEIERGKSKLGTRGEVLERNVVKKKVEAYALTIAGQSYKSWWLIHELLELKDKNAGYMHSLSSNYHSFGLSHDVIMIDKDKQLTFMIPPIPQIEDFIMAKTFEEIKAKNLRLDPSDGKLLMSFEFDFEKLASELIGIQTFIEDIKNGKDVFTDERLYLSTTPNRLFSLDYFINYSVLLGDRAFRTALASYLQKLSDKTIFTATFGDVDFEFVKQFVETIISGKDPLDSKRMLKKLIIKGQDTRVDLPIFAYIKVAKLINFNKNDVYSKICNYEKQEENEKFNINSKLHTLINKIGGETK